MEKSGRAREIYDAYLKGEITPEEAGKRAAEWYAARFGSSSNPTPREQ
mgnify:CR=1 FL=1